MKNVLNFCYNMGRKCDLSFEQCVQISFMHKEKYKQCDIAKKIGVHKATISRFVKILNATSVISSCRSNRRF